MKLTCEDYGANQQDNGAKRCKHSDNRFRFVVLSCKQMTVHGEVGSPGCLTAACVLTANFIFAIADEVSRLRMPWFAINIRREYMLLSRLLPAVRNLKSDPWIFRLQKQRALLKVGTRNWEMRSRNEEMRNGNEEMRLKSRACEPKLALCIII